MAEEIPITQAIIPPESTIIPKEETVPKLGVGTFAPPVGAPLEQHYFTVSGGPETIRERIQKEHLANTEPKVIEREQSYDEAVVEIVSPEQVLNKNNTSTT